MSSEQTSDLFAKVRQIHIHTRRLVNALMSGEYVSTFKGQGMEFHEVREYQPGDDIRAIDWNVTARTGTPYIKRFVEERELTLMILVDISSSVYFGTTDTFKREAMAEIASVLAFTAMINNDKVGLILFDDQVRKLIPPVKGKSHVLRLIQEILTIPSQGHQTNISHVLDTLNKIQKKRAIVFMISDFIDDNYSRSLRRTRRRHDLICVNVQDRFEKSLLALGLGMAELEDSESGEKVTVDLSSKKIKEFYQNQSRKQLALTQEECSKAKCDFIDLIADQDIAEPLLKFFRQRERRLSHYA